MIKKELELFEIFKASDLISGKFQIDVPIEKKIQKSLLDELRGLQSISPLTRDESKRLRHLISELYNPKYIDVICKTKDSTWVFEVEKELCPLAIGQVIEYGYLYSNKYPKRDIKLGIICEKINDKYFAKHLLKKYKIEIFIVDKKQNKAKKV
jgi:hypothetical protein